MQNSQPLNHWGCIISIRGGGGRWLEGKYSLDAEDINQFRKMALDATDALLSLYENTEWETWTLTSLGHFIQSSASHVLNDKSSFESTDLEQWFSTFFLRHFKTDFRWAMSSWIEVVREFKGKLQLYTKVLRAEHKYDYFISTLKILHISTYLNVPPPSCLKISVFL